MKKNTILNLITAVIAVLFFYAATSKLMDYSKSAWEMHNQVFPDTIAGILTWFIPVIELILMLALLFPKTRIKALWGSLFLLSAFTIYIGIVITGVFGRVPCSCGGILKNMPYHLHLIFNLFFIAIALTGLGITYGWMKDILFHHKRKEIARN